MSPESNLERARPRLSTRCTRASGSSEEANTRWLLNLGGATLELPRTASRPIDDIRVVIEITGG
jgi:hypothetical protein